MAGAPNRILKIERLTPTPAELEQRKVDRLRELRATIDALRGEQESQDPLLAWVKAQEKGEEKGEQTGEEYCKNP